MKKLTKAAAFFVVQLILFALLMTGCTKYVMAPDPPTYIEDASEVWSRISAITAKQEAETPSDSETVYNVVVDDSGSMRYFLNPGCLTYQAVITNLVDVSIGNSERVCYKSSDMENPISTVTFAKVCSDPGSYRNSTTELYKTLSDICDLYESGRGNDVYILLSDFVLTSVEEYDKIAHLLSDNFLRDGRSMGLIGWKAQYNGPIYDMPALSGSDRLVTVQAKQVSGKDESGIFRRPLYMLVLGNDSSVVKLMDGMLERCTADQLLNQPGQMEYFYYYDCNVEPRTIKSESIDKSTTLADITLSGELARYCLPNQDVKNMFLQLNDEEAPGYAEYSQHYKQFRDIPLYRVFMGVKNAEPEKGGNIVLNVDVPFKLTSSVKLNDSTVIMKEPLIAPADIEKKDIIVDIYELNTETGKFVAADSDIIERVDYEYNVKTGKVKVILKYNAHSTERDELKLYYASVKLALDPAVNEIKQIYTQGAEWLNDWTVNETIYIDEITRKQPYTQAEKTPYLGNLFVNALLDSVSAQSITDTIKQGCLDYESGALFGFVMRDRAISYEPELDTYEKLTGVKAEDNDWGFAFSQTESMEIPTK